MGEFGLNEVLGLIILVIGVGLLISEIRARQAGDMVTNIVITCLLVGVSMYNLITLCFKKESILLTIIYLIVIGIAIAYTSLFVIHYKKYHNKKDEGTNE